MVDMDVKLDHYDRSYYPNDCVSGMVVVNADSKISHNGIKLLVEGVVNLRLSPRSIGLLEAFHNVLKPMEIMNYSIEVASSDRLPKGKTELPFEFELKPKKNMKLYETYHGVYIDIQYSITVEMIRGFPNKNIKKSVEFTCKTKGKKQDKEKVRFSITPKSLRNVTKMNLKNALDFSIKGHFDSGVCNVEEPFLGEIILEATDEEVQSIELQLVRVETCVNGDTDVREATEVQNIQLADGNIRYGLPIPIYMIFPRMFTSVTMITRQFKIEFEVNVVVLFKDNHMLTENFPITLVRFPTNRNF